MRIEEALLQSLLDILPGAKRFLGVISFKSETCATFLIEGDNQATRGPVYWLGFLRGRHEDETVPTDTITKGVSEFIYYTDTGVFSAIPMSQEALEATIALVATEGIYQLLQSPLPPSLGD